MAVSRHASRVSRSSCLLLAIGWRSHRWRAVWLPVAVLVGVAAVSLTHWYVAFQGMADNPALPVFWIWVGLPASR